MFSDDLKCMFLKELLDNLEKYTTLNLQGDDWGNEYPYTRLVIE
jgi:hypothetical protein